MTERSELLELEQIAIDRQRDYERWCELADRLSVITTMAIYHGIKDLTLYPEVAQEFEKTEAEYFTLKEKLYGYH